MPRSFRLLTFLLLVAALPVGIASAKDDEKPNPPGVPTKAFQKEIDEAIDRGATWLRTEQRENGSFQGLTASAQMHHEIGTSALCGLALLAAGDKRGDAHIDKLYAFLQQKDGVFGASGGRTTYDTGILLMFITAYWRGKVIEEKPARGRTRPGRRGKQLPCNMPPEAQRWVQDLVNGLVRVRKAATSTWGYPAHRDDLSNTQYAFLGLRAARDCGAKVPNPVFVQAAKTLLERQEQDGPKVPRIMEPAAPGETKTVTADAGDRARGWSYLQEPYLPTGSMTTAGIAILAICHDALRRPKRVALYNSKMERAVTRSIQDGFSWLHKNWTVERNPGAGAGNWHFYYLYGLERAAIFGGRDLIGPYDWYIDGAKLLVRKQGAEGSWHTGFMGESAFEASDLVDTAWAILFLAKATRPMPPIRAPVVTPGD